jgi:hypothetical protein
MDLLALASTSASWKIACQASGSRALEFAFDPLFIARMARFGVIDMIERRIASSFSW